MKNMVKAVGIVMILTLFSRVMALISNQAYLIKLGITPQMDVFSFAISLPNIVFVAIGTALTTVVVPIFASSFENGDKKRAFGFINNITTLSILLAIILTLIGYILAPILVSFTAFDENGMSQYAVFAIRCMLPVMIFYGITFIFQGVLQSAGRFASQAIVSLPGSIIVILYVFLIAPIYGINGLIVATIIGLSFQVVIMIPSIVKTGFKFKFALNFREPDLLQAVKLIPPVFIGTSAWQLNMLFNSTLAANYKDGPTLIYLVQNLITSGVLTLVYSVTAVVFPKLTVLFSKGENKEFKDLFVSSINSILFLLIPLAVGFIMLGEHLLNLIFGWGKMTDNNIKMAGVIMSFYAIGVVGHSIKEVADRAFYATKETFLPAINGIIIMAVNIIASLILVRFYGVYGIPMGYSISLTIGAVVILFMLVKRVGDFGVGKMFRNLIRLIISSLIMAGGIHFTNKIGYNIESGIEILDRILVITIPSIIGLAIFFGVCIILKIKETQIILKKLRRM